MASVRIRLVSGAITVHRFVPRYTARADVVVDAMSIPGGMMRGWLHADPALFAAGGGQDGAYNLILLQYGTNEGADLKLAAIHQQIALAQRELGRQFRCEFWDWQAAMGGPGSAAAWARMTPPQMQGDLTHLTASGYRISGALFGHFLNLDKQ
jgi:hypothetical protein